MTKKKEETPVIAADTPLQTLILDCGKDKYRMVSLTTRWAIEVQKRPENASRQPEELVAAALKEILSGQVALEDIEKLPPAPKLERRLEAPAAVISDDLAKRIAEEDARAEKAAKAKLEEQPAEEEEAD